MAAGRSIKAGEAYVLLSLRDQLTKGLNQASKKLTSFGQGVTRVGAAVMGVGAGGLGGLFAAATQFASAGDQFDKMSARTGLAVENLSQLAFAANRSGTSIETVETGIKRLNRVYGDAINGSTEAQESLMRLGITAEQIANTPIDQRLDLVARGLNAVEDASLRSAYAQEVLGRSGADLLPMLAGLESLRGEASFLGLVFTGEDAKEAARLTDVMGDLQGQFKAVVLQVGAAVAGPMADYGRRLSEIVPWTIQWMRENRGLVITLAKGLGIVTVVGAGLLALGAAAITAGVGILAASKATSVLSVVSATFVSVGAKVASVGAFIGAGISQGSSVASAAMTKLYNTSRATLGAMSTAGAAAGHAIGSGVSFGMSAVTSLAKAGMKTAQVLRSEFNSGGAGIKSAIVGSVVRARSSLIGFLTSIKSRAFATFSAVRTSIISTFQITPSAVFASMKASAFQAFAAIKTGAAGMYASVQRNAAGVGAAIGRGFGAAGGLLVLAGAMGVGGVFAPFLMMAPLVISGLVSIGGAIVGLANPLGILAISLGAGVLLWAKYTKSGQSSMGTLVSEFQSFRGIGLETFEGIRDALLSGDLEGAAEIAMAGFGAAWSEGLAKLMENWGGWIKAIVETAADAFQEIGKLWATTQGEISKTLITASENDSPMFRGMLAGLGLGSLNPDTMLGVDMQAEQERRDRLNRELGLGPENVFDAARQQIDTATAGRVTAIESRVGEFMASFSAWADPAALRAAADARRQELADARERQKLEREQQRQIQDAASAQTAQEAATQGIEAAQTVASSGTFSAWAIRGMFGGGQEEQLKEQRAATSELRAIHGVLRRTNLVVVG